MRFAKVKLLNHFPDFKKDSNGYFINCIERYISINIYFKNFQKYISIALCDTFINIKVQRCAIYRLKCRVYK